MKNQRHPGPSKQTIKVNLNNEHETLKPLRLEILLRLCDQTNHVHHAEVVESKHVPTFRLIFADSLPLVALVYGLLRGGRTLEAGAKR